MRYEDLVKKVSRLPCFTTRFLVAGETVSDIRLQLARWVKAGKIIKLRKGVYTLPSAYRAINPEPFTIANRLKSPSYVSLQSALSWYGLIPEFVPATTSITTGRPEIIQTLLGRFEYRHVKQPFFWGYKKVQLSQNQEAFIALPEKALQDLVYFTTGGESRDFLEELRLQHVEKLDMSVLRAYAEKTGSHKIKKAVSNIEKIVNETDLTEL